MNASKKFTTLLILGTGAAMALTACSKTITRADAIKLLDGMNTTVTASGYVTPTKVTISTTNLDGTTAVDSNYDNAAVYGHTKYTGTSTVSSKSVTDKTEVWGFKDGTNYVLAYTEDGGSTGKFYSSTTDIISTIVSAKVASYVKTMTSSPASMKKYLSNFAEGTAAVSAGATVKSGTYMKSESYVTKGSGSLDMKITPNYGYDEAMEYKYENSRLTFVENDAHKSKTTYTWDKADTSKPGYSKWTAVTALESVVFISLVAALF